MLQGKIKDFVEGIYDGPHATPPEADQGPVFLGIKNVTTQGRLDLTEIRHISEEDLTRWTRRVTPQTDDIVFSYEATLHRYARIPEGFSGCLGRRMGLVRPNRNMVDPRFLHFYFLCRPWRAQVEANIISGATVDRIPLTRLPDFEIALPSLGEQQRIADAIAAYDNLIENNHRRIQLLEESARLLYREWFVHLRFPGHEHVKIVDGVPEGWRLVNIEDVASLIFGHPFKSKWFTDESRERLPIVRIRDVPQGRTNTYTSEEGPPDKKLRDGDVVIGMDGDFHMAFWSNGEGWLNQRVTSVRATEGISGYFLRFALQEPISYYNSTLTGTTVRHLGARHLREIRLLFPSEGVLRETNEFFDSIGCQVITLAKMNERLECARDLLLPRLMSGEITV